MPADNVDYDSMQAEYAAAVAQERACWARVQDCDLHPVERVKAYGAWLGAAERAMDLALKLRRLRPPDGDASQDADLP